MGDMSACMGHAIRVVSSEYMQGVSMVACAYALSIPAMTSWKQHGTLV